ncbi:response regulator transcription factor [Helicovermis profundi]|uniref:Stage 0 sporulation protein A homolog n=1 Tax=Helicovermis profundi TaxID=3065157 RepID=A0AAU9E7M2_9FIRM|nr:response regulator transcription factor [Clostridia bacterium S502]
MKKTEIRVFIIDDHEIIREGIKRILSFNEKIKLIGESNSGVNIIKILKNYKPDVLLLDMRMPEIGGLDVIKIIKSENLDVKIIALTIEDDKKTILSAINLGIDGYVLKESAGEIISRAIEEVYKGEKYIDHTLVNLLFSKVKTNNNSNIFDVLTKREFEVLYFISKGLSNKEISNELYLSEKTIKNYITNVFRKLEVNDRVKATILAIKNNIEEFYPNS